MVHLPFPTAIPPQLLNPTSSACLYLSTSLHVLGNHPGLCYPDLSLEPLHPDGLQGHLHELVLPLKSSFTTFSPTLCSEHFELLLVPAVTILALSLAVAQIIPSA